MNCFLKRQIGSALIALLVFGSTGNAFAYWELDDHVRISAEGDPDIWSTTYAYAEAPKYWIDFPVSGNSRILSTTKTWADAPPGYPYKTGIAHAYIKSKATFISPGGGQRTITIKF